VQTGGAPPSAALLARMASMRFAVTHLYGLAHYKVPKRFEFGDLPKTSTGKHRKEVLRDRARGHYEVR